MAIAGPYLYIVYWYSNCTAFDICTNCYSSKFGLSPFTTYQHTYQNIPPLASSSTHIVEECSIGRVEHMRYTVQNSVQV
jgi:hypothetical protein